jgi:hypothetical protein
VHLSIAIDLVSFGDKQEEKTQQSDHFNGAGADITLTHGSEQAVAVACHPLDLIADPSEVLLESAFVFRKRAVRIGNGALPTFIVAVVPIFATGRPSWLFGVTVVQRL